MVERKETKGEIKRVDGNAKGVPLREALAASLSEFTHKRRSDSPCSNDLLMPSTFKTFFPSLGGVGILIAPLSNLSS